MKLTTSDFKDLDKFSRVHLINSLSGPKSVNLLGTVDGKGQENLSVVSSCFHLGADPALMGMIIRPRSVPRHSYDNLVEMGCWTLNHVHPGIVKQAHQTSARYPKGQSEFEAVGLTPQYHGNFAAPFVNESRIQLGLQLCESQTLRINGTVLVIGEVTEIHFDESIKHPDGYLDIAKAESIAVGGLDAYHQIQLIDRFNYAKPDQEVHSILDPSFQDAKAKEPQ